MNPETIRKMYKRINSNFKDSLTFAAFTSMTLASEAFLVPEFAGKIS